MITETQDTLNTQQEVSTITVLHVNEKDNMTQVDEIHMEGRRPYARPNTAYT